MDKYVDSISRLFKQGSYPFDAFFIDKAFENRKIIVYGAGECAHYLIEIVMRIHKYSPVAVLDRAFKRGDTYVGIPASSPLEFEPTEDEKRNAIVIICVGKEAYYDEIIKTLKGLGFQNIIFLMNIYEIHNPFNLPAELGKKGWDFYRDQKESIFACLELFKDVASREIYARFLQTHMERKPVFLPMRPREEQYFPKDIPLSRGYSRFICCGCDTGETIRLLSRFHGRVDSLACIEPDATLFAGLADYLWEHKDKLARNIVALPCAAYSKDAIMPFSSANKDGSTRPFYPTGFGSRILDGGETFVQSITLDHTLPGFDPTFIAIDVEGAELDVLMGAERIIRTGRPDLGVCVYHSPSHLWEIPLYLHSLGLGYRFYLRNYTTFISETVLYATTEAKR